MTQERKDQYITLAVLTIGFTLIGMRFHHLSWVILAGTLLLMGLISSYMLRKITLVWTWIGETMGAVMSRVIMGIIFVFFLSPMAIIYRTFSKKKAQVQSDSYFIERNHTYIPNDLEKVF